MQVLTLSGVARIFHTKREVLQKLGDFPRAWALLLEFIESSSLSKNNEVRTKFIVLLIGLSMMF